MTDESGQTYPDTVNTLLDRALGAEGYYGAFVANMHTDADTSGRLSSVWARDIVNSAIARGVPVVSGRQMLTWLDARNNSSINPISWDNTVLTCRVVADANARGLQVMAPVPVGRTVSSVERVETGGNVVVAYSLKWVKGVHYVVFPAISGSHDYQITYGSDSGRSECHCSLARQWSIGRERQHVGDGDVQRANGRIDHQYRHDHLAEEFRSVLVPAAVAYDPGHRPPRRR